MSRAKKKRTQIPDRIVAGVLFGADHTCCVCRDARLEVQIHHIDANPSNHEIANLAPLCFHDHNRTLMRGGFGRHLSATEIKRYRDDWIVRVAERRQKADELSIIAMAQLKEPPPSKTHPDFIAPPLTFVFALPNLRRVAIERVAPGWSGSTVEMRTASQQYVDALQAVLIALASYLPSSEVEGVEPRNYFSKHIAERLAFHRRKAEADGPGTGGSIVSVEAWGGVISDVENLVEKLVMKLAARDNELDFARWKREWDESGTTSQHTVCFAGHWQHYYPVEYVGPVWIRFVPANERRQKQHHVALRWGPWKFEQQFTFEASSLCLVTGKGPDAHPVPLFVSAHPDLNVTFGVGPPPCTDTHDIYHRWYPA